MNKLKQMLGDCHKFFLFAALLEKNYSTSNIHWEHISAIHCYELRVHSLSNVSMCLLHAPTIYNC